MLIYLFFSTSTAWDMQERLLAAGSPSPPPLPTWSNHFRSVPTSTNQRLSFAVSCYVYPDPSLHLYHATVVGAALARAPPPTIDVGRAALVIL